MRFLWLQWALLEGWWSKSEEVAMLWWGWVEQSLPALAEELPRGREPSLPQRALPLQPPPARLSKLPLMRGEDNSDLPLRAVKD